MIYMSILFWAFNYLIAGIFCLYILRLLANMGYNIALCKKWNEIQLLGKIESGHSIFPGSWTTVTVTLFCFKISTK